MGLEGPVDPEALRHARKTAASRPGQALRGSSELHAWGDSNLYLRRRKDRILLSAEHRNAPGLDEIELQLADTGAGPALQMMEPAPDHPEPETAARRILAVIAQATRPLSQREIRQKAATRPATVTDTLHRLIGEGRIEAVPGGGYRLATAAQAEG